ncbi:MAG: FtsH protease activity modulator HflK [Sedimentisphaerales bacterium]|nr:FtsH protease activity modulator HflK [Sedimentisphaerales bacterium]
MPFRRVTVRVDDFDLQRMTSATFKWAEIALVMILILVGAASSVYTVPTDSVGVIKRFGSYHRSTEPGIHVKIPFWIETVTAVPVKKVQKEEFGFRTLKAGVDSQYLGAEEIDSARYTTDELIRLIEQSGERAPRAAFTQLGQMARDILRSEYIMLTGDLNIVDVEWIAQYKIKDAGMYLFNIKEPRQTIRDASQAVMRQLVGNGSVDEAITIGRIEYENSARDMLQTLLDEYETGIQIVTVKLQSSNPPLKVRPAFNEVNKALQQKEQRINEAMKEYNETIPKTKGEAKKLIETARGYAAERVNRAEGDAAKFMSIYTEYEKAPDITKQRMYLEAMSKLLPQISEKWIIEQGGAEGGLLMKLDLENSKD